jgi:hypothetical protein
MERNEHGPRYYPGVCTKGLRMGVSQLIFKLSTSIIQVLPLQQPPQSKSINYFTNPHYIAYISLPQQGFPRTLGFHERSLVVS